MVIRELLGLLSLQEDDRDRRCDALLVFRHVLILG